MKKRTLFLAAVLAFAILFGSIVGNAASKTSEPTYYKYYTSIMIESGDTLWDIAKAQDPDGRCNASDYIEELRRINHLESDEIHAGQHLTVFYYDTELK